MKPPQQRAFAGKRNKMTAADVRRHVMTGSLLLNPPGKDESDAATEGDEVPLCLLDVVDPVDVEEALSQRKASALYDISSTTASASPRKVSEFPADDVEVRCVPREQTTVDPPIQGGIDKLCVEPHIRDALTAFGDSFSLVQRRYQQFGTADAFVRMRIERPIVARTATRHVYEGEGEEGGDDGVSVRRRVARSASVVGEECGKRESYTSSSSTGTMGSDGDSAPRLHSSHADATVPGVLSRVSHAQLDQLNEQRRQSGRHSHMLNLLPPQNESDVIEKRGTPLFPEERTGQKLIVKIVKLHLEPYFEPVFGSVAVYDVKAKRKVTENFYFDVNPDPIRRLLPGGGVTEGGPVEEAVARCQQAAFSLSLPLTHLFLVVKLEKVLSGCDVSEAADGYVAGARDERQRDKMAAQAAEYCNRLGAYRMPLGFVFVDLARVLFGLSASLERGGGGGNEMTASVVTTGSGHTIIADSPAPGAHSDTDSIVSADRVSVSTTSTFRRIGSGTSAATVLQKVRTPQLKRRFLGGDDAPAQTAAERAEEEERSARSADAALAALTQPLTITLTSFYRHEADRLSEEELLKVLAEARRGGGGGSKITRLKTFPCELRLQLSGGTGEELLARISPDLLRVCPFQEGGELTRDIHEFAAPGNYAVNTGYRNLLYIYPKALNLSSRTGTARNISIRCELMSGGEEPLKALFSQGGGCTYRVHTSVVYHNKCPQLSDEIKVRLPVDLDDGHHLLFTFYHVSCKAAGGGNRDEPVEMPIGYTWLPLYRGGRLESGEHHLPISTEKLPQSYGYLSPSVHLPNVKWLDGHKPLFTVDLKAVSTVHAQDEHLERLFLSVSSLYSTSRKQPPVGETELIQAVQGVIKARPEPMVAFLYSVLDKLLMLIANPPYSDTVSSACFETLGQLVKICTMLLDRDHSEGGRSALLHTYAHYFKIASKESKAHSPLCRELAAVGGQPGSPETQKLFCIIEDVEKSAAGGRVSTGSAADAVQLTNNKCIHEELAEQWVRSGGAAREMAFSNAWFFLQLMNKSMAEYLSMTGRLYLARKSRFSDKLIASLDALSSATVTEVMSRAGKDPRQAAALTHAWAFFLRDSLSLMDRSYVMGLVRDFNRTIAIKISASPEPLAAQLVLVKLDLLRVVCSHEHFIVLNLPFGGGGGGAISSGSSASSCLSSVSSVGVGVGVGQLQPASPGGSSLSSRWSGSGVSLGSVGGAELTTEFRQRHFLVGLVLADVAAVLETSRRRELHARAIRVVRNLLSSHEADARLAEPQLRARVAALYLPLISIVLDASAHLHDPFARQPHPNFVAASRFSDPGTGSLASVNQKVALAIAGMDSFGEGDREEDGAGRDGLDRRTPPTTPVKEAAAHPARAMLDIDMTRELLACVCWVVRHVDGAVLRAWMREQTPTRLAQLLLTLQTAASCFEWRGERDLDDCSEVDEMEPAPIARKESGVRWRRSTTQVGDNERRRRQEARKSRGAESAGSAVSILDEPILEGALCAEISLCVLDCLETVLRVVHSHGCDHLAFAARAAVKAVLHLLACRQSQQVLDSVFASQRAMVVKWPDMIFQQETELCGELCLQLLRHCASRLGTVRSQAAASLYLLMREAYENGGSLAKVKMQITMSLSTLVSNGTRVGVWLNEDCLRRSFKTMLTYCDSDASSDCGSVCPQNGVGGGQRVSGSFSEQVKDLVFNLHMILSDTVKLKEHANDFEMTVDLMYRVAKGYQNNPDLRLTWLLNMAAKHADRALFCEAGHCVLHAAALAAEYITMRSVQQPAYLPRGASAFEPVSVNVAEESAVSDDVLGPSVDGVCESRHFSEAGLIHLVEKAAHFFEKAHLYELLPDTYKTIECILREWRDFRRLAAMYARMSGALSRIEPHVAFVEHASDAWTSPLRGCDKRCFGTYFRVGFYGQRFGDVDGDEYVYKEPPFTKLSEISHRLEAFYTDRFGRGVVEVIKDSNTVDRSSQDVSRAYLQITYVEPYLEAWERRRRPTHFERTNCLRRFVYATPFTKDGRAHGDLKEQYKRRCVLTVEKAFPYVKTRIRVVDRQTTVLQPIQVALEDVEKRTRELAAAVAQQPADAKMLQMVLQGCIGTTVNQGPLQVAQVFLSEPLPDERGRKAQNKLRLCFRDFSRRCAEALTLNKQLIQHDQHAYQSELQKNYVDFTRKMAPLMSVVNEGRRSVEPSLDAPPMDSPPPPPIGQAPLEIELDGPVTNV